MKRILLFLVLTATTLWSCAQTVVQRAGQANTVNDPRHMASLNSFQPTYADTTEANLHKGVDSVGAIIYTYDAAGFWYRQHSPKRWVRFTDMAATGVVQSITIINDSSVRICTGVDACDTLNFDTHITNITSTYFLTDSSIVLCNLSVCDTVAIPRQPVYLFQNALTQSGNITEWGGKLLHDTKVDAGYFSTLFSGATLEGYPYRFYQQQGHQGSTGIVAFERAGNYTSPNAVALGVHSWDSTRQNDSVFIPGYFGPRTGYAMVTNFLSSQRTGWAAVAQDTSSKVSGLFLNTDDGDKNNEAFTLFGLSEADMAADQVRDSLTKGKILTGRTSGDITLWKYPSTRNDGTLTKALGTDASGNVILGTLPSLALTADNGLTASSASNVQLGGTLLKNTAIAAGAYTLNVQGSGASSLLQVVNTGSGNGVYGRSDGSGSGVYGQSGSGTGIGGYSASGLAAFFASGHPTNNTAVQLVKEQRETSGVGADGIGYYRSGYIKGTTGFLVDAFREEIKLTTAQNDAAVAHYGLHMVNGGVMNRKLALAGSGKLTLDTYGDGLHTGTATKALGVDVDGNVIEMALGSGGGALTADNGLTASTATNVQLGGTLLQNTTIGYGAGSYRLEFTNGGVFDGTTGGTRLRPGQFITNHYGEGGQSVYLSLTGQPWATPALGIVYASKAGDATVSIGSATGDGYNASLGLQRTHSGGNSELKVDSLKTQLRTENTAAAGSFVITMLDSVKLLQDSNLPQNNEFTLLSTYTRSNSPLVFSTNYTPTSSSDGTYPVGAVTFDDGFVYFRTSTGTWKKIAWTTF
jgi:hypothetical protein